MDSPIGGFELLGVVAQPAEPAGASLSAAKATKGSKASHEGTDRPELDTPGECGSHGIAPVPARRQAGCRESTWWSWGRGLHGERKRIRRHQRGRPGAFVQWMIRDLPITPTGRMIFPCQQHPLSRESPLSPENAGGDRAFATCVFGSRTFLKCSLPGQQRIRFFLTTLIWSGKTSARASSTPPSISTILSSSDRPVTCGSSSTLSCHLRWHGF